MTIRKTIQAQADKLGLTAYAIARDCGKDRKGKWIVSPRHIQNYFSGEKDMTSARIDAIFKVLGLRVTIA